MSFKSILGGVGNVIRSGASGIAGQLAGNGDNGDQQEFLRQYAERAAADVEAATPKPVDRPFELPGLDETLSPEGEARRQAAEQAGEDFEPGEDDYLDKGPYGFLHKRRTQDLFLELQAEMEKNAKENNVDYAGVARQRLKDLADQPEEHRANPFVAAAIALGGGEKGTELVKAYQGNVAEGNKKQTERWKELLQTKQDAIKGAMQQAMAIGDMRTIVQKKWADQLMEIEDAKAKLEGQLALQAEKNLGTAKSAEIRAQAARDSVAARARAMLDAVGMKMDSAEYRNAIDAAVRRLNGRIKAGETPENAWENVLEELHDEYDSRVRKAHGGTVPDDPRTPEREDLGEREGKAVASENPLERRARERREAAAAAAKPVTP